MIIKSKMSGGNLIEIRDEGTTWGRGRYVLYVNGYVETSSDDLSMIISLYDGY